MEYASRAVGNAALTTGIIGTALGAMNGAGGLLGILGGTQQRSQSSDPGDRPVTRYEMGLMQENNALKNELSQLRSERYADAKSDALQAQLNQNSIWVATATANMGFMSEQIQKLSGMTRLAIPDTNVVTFKTAAVSASDTSAAANG